MEVTEEELASHPEIAPLLRQNGVLPHRVVEVLRCDSSPESLEFVRYWDSLTPDERTRAGIEAIALAADLTPRRVYELFLGAAMMQSRDSVGLTIALALPDVMRRTVKEAKTAKGHYAREHLYKAARVLPSPKGSVTNINVGKQPEELGEGDDMESGNLLEPSDEFMMRASKAMGVKQLPAVASEVVE